MEFTNRKIFKYFDGRQERYGDPVELDRALVLAAEGDIEEILKLAKSSNAIQAAEYQGRLLKAIYKTFDLEPYNSLTGEGVISDDAWKVLGDFWEWQAKKKANTTPSPSSPQPTEFPVS